MTNRVPTNLQRGLGELADVYAALDTGDAMDLTDQARLCGILESVIDLPLNHPQRRRIDAMIVAYLNSTADFSARWCAVASWGGVDVQRMPANAARELMRRHGIKERTT